MSDHARVEATAPVWVNSRSSLAAVVREQGQASAPSFNVVGNAVDRHRGRFYGKVNTRVQAIADPLFYLPEPSSEGLVERARARLDIRNQRVTLKPGIYRRGIRVRGRAQVTLEPGLYVIDGRLDVGGSAELTGREVLLYFPTTLRRTVLRMHSSGRVSLSPPLSGPYRGIVIFQRRAERARLRMRGCGEMRISGMIYSPQGRMRVSGGTKGTMASQVIAHRLRVRRRANAAFPYDSELAPIGCYPE